ncbi:SDR family oxidoreductase [Actinomyces sp. 2119]|nr:SDR family oxidoreductase [Actinomyces sp. 2119]
MSQGDTDPERPRQRGPVPRSQETVGLLRDRTVLVTGVLRPSSIATAVAAVAADQGARVLLTGVPRTIGATQALARRLGLHDPVLPLDVATAGSVTRLASLLGELGVSHLDGLVHCLAHADASLLGSLLARGAGDDSASGAEGPGQPAGAEALGQASAAPGTGLPGRRAAALEAAFTVTTASLPALVGALGPLLGTGSAVVALTFDSGRVHPGYGWMGPLKAALEASVRTLAVELGGAGVRVNALSAGPLRTPAASAVPSFEGIASRWTQRAPLGWDPDDADPVARTAVALLSGWLPATTGQVVYADGGVWLAGA